jgi:hypothetical protein
MLNILQNSAKNNYKLPHIKNNYKSNYLKLLCSLPALKEVIITAIDHLKSNLERVEKILKSNK